MSKPDLPAGVCSPDDAYTWLFYMSLHYADERMAVQAGETYFGACADKVKTLLNQVACLKAEVAELNGYLADSQLDGHERDRNAAKVRVLWAAMVNVLEASQQPAKAGVLTGELATAAIAKTALEECNRITER